MGSRIMIPRELLDQFILDNTLQPCREEIPVRASASSKSAAATTSSAPKVDAAASAQRALQIAGSTSTRLVRGDRTSGRLDS